MLAVLPVLCFGSLFLVLRKFQVLGWRGSFLLAALIWGMIVTVLTEFFSLFKWLSFWPVLSVWSLIFLFCWVVLVFYKLELADLRIRPDLNGLSRFEISLLICLFLMVVFLGVIAWMVPPNTWDSMTYHLSRVVHWMQNQSVAFYPTIILRQLHQAPWSEFAILHFQILNGNDIFANFVQWFSMVGSLVGVSLLAKEFKTPFRGQLIAMFVSATIPMGILQSTSTQSDYVVSFWLVCFVYFGMRFQKKADFVSALGTGLGLGLAFLTKATAYLFAIPFILWLVIFSIKRFSVKRMLLIPFVFLLAFGINFGHYTRNYDLYGSPFGPGEESGGFRYANELFSFSSVTSNIIRNIGLHMGTSYSSVDVFIDNEILLLHRFLGISINDVRTTWSGTEFHIQATSFSENNAGNPLHLFLITAALLLYLLQLHQERDVSVSIYASSLLLAFVLFCAYLKWQPWHSRLHLPLFVLFSPFLGLVFSRFPNARITNLLMVLLILMALPWVLGSLSKPVFGSQSIFVTDRDEQYFTNHPYLIGPYRESVQILSNLHCAKVGLIIRENDWEYPLWVLLQEKMNGLAYLEHVNVQNISRKYAKSQSGNFVPCALFTVGADLPPVISSGEVVYSKEWFSNPVGIYKQVSSP